MRFTNRVPVTFGVPVKLLKSVVSRYFFSTHSFCSLLPWHTLRWLRFTSKYIAVSTVLAEDDIKAYFFTSNVVGMLGEFDGARMVNSPAVAISRSWSFWRHSSDLSMIRLDNLLQDLEEMKTPRARASRAVLQHNTVRDLPYHETLPPQVIQSTDFYEITFPSWLKTFKKTMNPHR